ncbi:MATE family efflux transporter [Croceiramulus getboli]|nr:MATE family efflux transporter [Flavobacteriaceae bacterium YJPT1-3]
MNLRAYTQEFPQNLKIALPVMLGQLGHILVALADNLMVGQLGAAELAAVSLGNSLVFVALALGIGFSFAITPLVAEADGAEDTERGRSYFHHGVVMCTVNGILLFLVLLLAKPLLFYMDQPEEVVVLAVPYMEIVALSLVPLMIFQAFKQFADGLSQTKYAMYATLSSNVVNVFFNFVLIYGLWFFPPLEVEGAAWGTLISRFFMLAVLVLILKRKKKFAPYFYFSWKEKWSGPIFKRLFDLGVPTALQMLLEVALFTSAIILSGILGTNAQAANQIALNLAAMTYMIAVGLGVTATIRVGNQKGRNDFIRLRRVAQSIFLQVFLIEALFAFGFVATRFILPTFYIDNAEVISIAAQLLLIAAFFQLSDGLQVVILGALRGLQDVWVPTLICLIAYGLIGFPIAWYSGTPERWASTGIWLGLLAGLTASAVMLYFRFEYLNKRQVLMAKNTTA